VVSAKELSLLAWDGTEVSALFSLDLKLDTYINVSIQGGKAFQHGEGVRDFEDGAETDGLGLGALRAVHETSMSRLGTSVTTLFTRRC